ncbi:MAG TPA: hypothetical protein VKB79_04365 [Bryobacteraceae bacterium]|nr:hypothetical protein [Bryobacteraceae bacterium]
MSRNALIFEKTALRPAAPSQPWTATPTGDYAELIHLAFRDRSALAVINIGPGPRAGTACAGIARELAASGRRTVIVQVKRLAKADRMPAVANCVPGEYPNVWLWPATPDGSVEFFHRPIAPATESEWLGELRRKFDAVLLDCSGTEGAGAAEFAVKADAAVLVVEAGRTTKQQIQREQRGLNVAGVNLVGCVLI